MYVKDIATTLEVSESTVLRVIRELYPTKMVKGKATQLNREQVVAVRSKLKITGEISDRVKIAPRQGDEVVRQGDELNIQVLIQQAVTASMQAMLPLFKQVIEARPVPQIELTQDYYSILGYCRKNNLTITFSEAVAYGKCAVKKSKEKGVEVRRIADERFGTVGSYHIDVLREVFAL
jgi:DNA-directed RNA polymerase specialized sigma54-like protein